MTDQGKEILFLERRQERAKNTLIIFTDEFGFITLKKPAKDGKILLNNIKYFGKITKDMLGDRCTCQSFYHGNSDKWQAEHGTAFQCKHIIKAHSMMEGYW